MEETPPQCRLCLYSEKRRNRAEKLRDVFVENRDGIILADIIRDCLSVYIIPDEPARWICQNCELTVDLIRDFRLQCHMADEAYGTVELSPKHYSCRPQYYEKVTELRSFVREHRNNINSTLPESDRRDSKPFVLQLPIKTEMLEEEGQQSAFDTSQAVDTSQDIDTSQAIDTSLTVDVANLMCVKSESSTEYDPDEAERAEAEPEEANHWIEYNPSDGEGLITYSEKELPQLKLKLAKLVDEYVSQFTTLTETNKKIPWRELAKKMRMDWVEVRRIWMDMNKEYENFRTRDEKIADSSPEEEQMFQLMGKLVPVLEQIPKDQKITKKLYLAKKVAIVESVNAHPNVLNPKLSSADSLKLWTKIAVKLKLNVESLRYHWERLLSLYLAGAPVTQSSEDERIAKMMKSIMSKTKPSNDTPRKSPRKTRAGASAEETLPAPSNTGRFIVSKNGKIQKTIACEVCGKIIRMRQFEVHMNNHLGVKPYACSFEGCERRFTHKSKCALHERIDHSQDAHKFKCDKCGEIFPFRSKLNYHIATKHESHEIPCKICGKVFSHKLKLNSHMLTHKMEKCKVCSKLFKVYSIPSHMLQHTNEKPFGCDVCGERFRHRKVMKRHVLTVHNLNKSTLATPKSKAPRT